MNNQVAEGKWKVLKGKIRAEWGDLTEDELDKTKGNLDQIAGKIQTKYGDTLDGAQKKLNGLLEAMSQKMP